MTFVGVAPMHFHAQMDLLFLRSRAQNLRTCKHKKQYKHAVNDSYIHLALFRIQLMYHWLSSSTWENTLYLQ